MLVALLKIVFVLAAVSGAVAYLVFIERRVAGFIQDRLGPNRVGPQGLFQPIADGLKFVFKEQLVPAHVDRALYLLAPAVIMVTAMVAFAVIPFGPDGMVVAPGIDIGILYVFAVGSMAVYGVILGGWSSNNKYSFYGAMRSSAQLISYEIPLGLSVLGVVLLTGSLRLDTIIAGQVGPQGAGWYVFVQPLGFLVFLISAFAEAGRLPFDLPEAEQELIGGYHTEYSGMKFGMFALAEYTHLITASFVGVTLFFGGWHLPLVAPYVDDLQGFRGVLTGFWMMCVFVAKVVAGIFLAMWIRWSWPRFRFDQLMSVAWKIMVPMALANFVLTAAVAEFLIPAWWVMLPASFVFIGLAVWFWSRPRSAPAHRRASIPAQGEVA